MEETKETNSLDKWVIAVLDILKLTQEGKLTWKRAPTADVLAPEYETYSSDKTFRLKAISPFATLSDGIRNLNEAVTGRSEKTGRRYPFLSVQVSGGASRVSFPDIAPLGALETAIEAQVSQEEDSILRQIHELAMP